MLKYAMVFAAAAVAGFGAPQVSAQSLALTKCAQPLGMVAVMDGDAQGWTQYRLGSPRLIIEALAKQSGCFTLRNPASVSPPQFILNVTAGTRVDQDQTLGVAAGAATNAMLGNSMLGGAMSMLGGAAGKTKTMVTAVQIIDPANRAILVSGSGEANNDNRLGKSDLQPLLTTASEARYLTQEGLLLTQGFIKAFNAMVAKASVPGALQSAGTPAAVQGDRQQFVVAVATSMREAPSKTAEALRDLGTGTTLKPTGKREGNFVEMTDIFGTTGWVNIEDLK